MEFTRKDAIIKQILLYLTNRDFRKAQTLSKELVEQFPQDLLSNYLAAKSSYWAEDYLSAEQHARKAFNIAQGQDMIPTAIMLGCVLFMKREYTKGYHFLETVEDAKITKEPAEFQELMTVYSLALNNPKAAVMHVNRLYDINPPFAKEFILKYMYPNQ